MTLRLDWVSARTARRAVLKWHYSRTMPMPKYACLGVWESGDFVGAVIFAHGSNYRIGAPYGLGVGQVVELVRVALRRHVTPVSRILSVALRMLRHSSPGVELVVSYADPVQGHVGTIYQAANWTYLGMTSASYEYRLNGKRLHKRAFTGANFGGRKMQIPVGAERVATPGKHIYAKAMTAAMRLDLCERACAYPKGPLSMNMRQPSRLGDGGSTRPAGSNQ